MDSHHGKAWHRMERYSPRVSPNNGGCVKPKACTEGAKGRERGKTHRRGFQCWVKASIRKKYNPKKEKMRDKGNHSKTRRREG